MPSSLDGIYDFFVEMQCNDANVLANKTIEVRRFVPILPFAENLEIDAGGGGKQLEFSYQLQTNSGEPVPIHVQERIVQNEEIIWQNSQNVSVAQGTEIKRLGPILPLGNYKLIVDAASGQEKATVARDFEVKAATAAASMEFPFMQAIAIGAVALLLFASLFIAARFFAKAPILQKPFAPFPLISARQGAVASEERLKLFESDSTGVADELEVDRLLDAVGRERLALGNNPASGEIIAKEAKAEELQEKIDDFNRQIIDLREQLFNLYQNVKIKRGWRRILFGKKL